MSRGDAPWRVVRVSVTGTSHHAQKLPCQDASYDAVRDDFCVVAVADGVGSARYSEVGAKTAVESATTFLVEHYVPYLDKIGWRQLMQEAAAHALEEIRLISTKREHELRSYASTLLLAVVDRQRVVAFHVGDGAIVALVDDKLVALTVPQKGEFANEVFPLTKPGAMDNAQFHYGDRSPNALALFTDGIESLAMDMATRVPHERFFLPIFERARDVESDKLREEIRLLFEQKAAQRSDDDMTLAIWVREKPREAIADSNREVRSPKPDSMDVPPSKIAPSARKEVDNRLPPPIRSDRAAPVPHAMGPVGRRRDDPENELVPLGIPRTNLPVPNRVNRILAALSGLFIVEHIVIFVLWSYDVFNIGPPAIPTAKSATVTHPVPTAQPPPKSLPEKPPPQAPTPPTATATSAPQGANARSCQDKQGCAMFLSCVDNKQQTKAGFDDDCKRDSDCRPGLECHQNRCWLDPNAPNRARFHNCFELKLTFDIEDNEAPPANERVRDTGARAPQSQGAQ